MSLENLIWNAKCSCLFSWNPITHEKTFPNHISYQRLGRSSKLIRYKESTVTNSNRQSSERFQVSWTLIQDLSF